MSHLSHGRSTSHPSVLLRGARVSPADASRHPRERRRARPGVLSAPDQIVDRVLRPAGRLAAFDGDYATTTVAIGDNDPLQACADEMMANSVNDRMVMRRLRALVQERGFEIVRSRSHGFVETTEAGYMLTVVDRGADLLLASRQIGDQLAAALKAEARRRADAGAFFGHVAYVSLIARKA